MSRYGADPLGRPVPVIRILSGVQPTGEIHLGNYLGALRHWVATQADAECLYLLADLHAITVPQDHGDLQGSATVGLFAYPVLQAADILLYQADRVPVGEDQKQHLELTRDLAQRFNNQFGEIFKVPESLIAPVGARIMDLQDPRRKMSKSSESPRGTISLTDSPDVIRAKIRSAVTDSGREIKVSADKPAMSNLLSIYTLAAGSRTAEAEQAFVGKGYAQFKKALADAVVDYLRPIREHYDRVHSEPQQIRDVLRSGAEKARTIAARTLAQVYDHLGFLPR